MSGETKIPADETEVPAVDKLGPLTPDEQRRRDATRAAAEAAVNLRRGRDFPLHHTLEEAKKVAEGFTKQTDTEGDTSTTEQAHKNDQP